MCRWFCFFLVIRIIVGVYVLDGYDKFYVYESLFSLLQKVGVVVYVADDTFTKFFDIRLV